MDLMRWPVAQWKFKKNKKARQDVAPPQEVHNLLSELRRRQVRWDQMSATVGGPEHDPDAVREGRLGDDVVLGPGEWAMLCKVDGERSLADLASDCGFTVYEAATGHPRPDRGGPDRGRRRRGRGLVVGDRHRWRRAKGQPGSHGRLRCRRVGRRRRI